MECIRVLIVDDHRLFRQGLVSMLQSEPEFEVVGEAASGEEALRLAADRQPDVALVDLQMPGMAGIEVLARLSAQRPALGLVVLTASENDVDLISAIQAGAKGYVLKNAEADSLFNVIRKVHLGGAALCEIAMPRVLELLRGFTVRSVPGIALTPREQEVLALMMEGRDNHEIAARLVISANTVKTHVSHILEKVGKHSRAELIAAGPLHITRY